MPSGQKRAHLVRQAVGISRHQQFQVAGDDLDQRLLLDEVGQCDQDDGEQRYDGKKGVVGHRTGQEQALAALKVPQDMQREPGRPAQHARVFGIR